MGWQRRRPEADYCSGRGGGVRDSGVSTRQRRTGGGGGDKGTTGGDGERPTRPAGPATAAAAAAGIGGGDDTRQQAEAEGGRYVQRGEQQQQRQRGRGLGESRQRHSTQGRGGHLPLVDRVLLAGVQVRAGVVTGRR